MNLDTLTIGQAREIAEMFSRITGGAAKNGDPKFDGLIGEYVIVRSRNEGINAGFVVVADSDGIVLKECRRLFYHKPKKTSQCWYEGVANMGLSSDSKLSPSVISKTIIEDYSITRCTPEAIESIRGHKSHEQS